jgi:hypothetical protein
MIFAVDPGNELSGYAIFDGKSLKPKDFGKVENERLKSILKMATPTDEMAIEMIRSYGMGVGESVFETCVWIGRFCEAFRGKTTRIYRLEEKLHICHSPKANDVSIRHALIDRFAEHDKVSGKGTKKNPDFFYGFKADCWAAFAVGLTYIETKREE